MPKRIIIIEGTDNSGKDTLISNLAKHFGGEQVEIKHFDRPKSKSNEECAKEQNESFLAFVDSMSKTNDDRIVILNRAWYGELVYGTLYRGRAKGDVLEMIWECEKRLKDANIPTTYIQLYAESEFLSKNDDGQSLSDGNAEKISEESALFIEAYENSKLSSKAFIKVNNGDNFIPKEEVMKKALDAILS